MQKVPTPFQENRIIASSLELLVCSSAPATAAHSGAPCALFILVAPRRPQLWVLPRFVSPQFSTRLHCVFQPLAPNAAAAFELHKKFLSFSPSVR